MTSAPPSIAQLRIMCRENIKEWPRGMCAWLSPSNLALLLDALDQRDAALRELIACKDLHDQAERDIAACKVGAFTMLSNYRERKGPACATARALLADPPAGEG